MNRKHKDLLTFIRKFIGENEYSPSYRQIADGMDLKSLSAIKTKLTVLQAEGHILILGRQQGIVLLGDDHARQLNSIKGLVFSHSIGDMTTEDLVDKLRKKLKIVSRL
jgi:SOS-response transcriptional repressor LexA